MKATQTTMMAAIPEYEVEGAVGYRPRIKAEQMGELRRLKEKTDKPITELVEEALEQYLEQKRKDLDSGLQESLLW